MVKSKVKKSAPKPPRKKTARKAPASKHQNKADQKKDSKPAAEPGKAKTRRPVVAQVPPVVDALVNAANALGPIKSQSGVDLTEKIKELVRLAQEQGYLTYNDINDALPDNVVSPDDLDEIYIKLRSLEVEIVDQAEVDRVKQPEPDAEA